MFNDFVIYAADATTGAAAGAQNSGNTTMTIFGNLEINGEMIYLFYIFVIKPQKKKAKEHSLMITELNEGDVVITSGGIKGEIVAVTDDFFEVRIDKGVKITIKKNYIQGLYK